MLRNPEWIYAKLRVAVLNKRPIAATYHGRLRFLCPHRLGWNKEGHPRVLCYQYGGQSESGLKKKDMNWRCLSVEELTNVEFMAGSWRTAPNHSRPQTCIDRVDVDAED